MNNPYSTSHARAMTGAAVTGAAVARSAAARVAVSTLLLCVAVSLPAWAALGGNAASVAADAAALRGEDHTTLLQSYDIHEITDANGMRIREYLSRGGTVFAVAWSGPVLPELQRLLGSHFQAYADALSAQPRAVQRRSLRVATPGIVVESGGHMRAISGRAYLPTALPAGVSAVDIR